MTPTFNRPMEERTAFVRSPFGLPSGGPQPASSTMMASNATSSLDQFNPFKNLNNSFGFPYRS